MAFLDPIFNPVLQPLVSLSPFWAVVILSFVITVIVTVIYKYFSNQSEMKRIRDEQKESQKRMKDLRDKPEELMKIQKEAMSKNFEYMKHSFKPTLITFLPIILIFGWMNAHLAFEPIFPGERFSITAQFTDGVTGDAELVVGEQMELLSDAKQPINSKVTWNMKSGREGEHFLSIKTKNDEQTKKVLIAKDVRYEEPLTFYKDSDVKSIQINYNKLRPMGSLSIFGWQPGWLGVYVILSIAFSLGLRKMLKVY